MKKKKGSTNVMPKQRDKDSYVVKKSGQHKLDEISDKIDSLQKDLANQRQHTSMKFQMVLVYLQGIAKLLR